MSEPTNAGTPAGDLTLGEQQLFRRFIAALYQDIEAAPVLRAQRFEIVDARGRPRLVIGPLGNPDANVIGIGMYDRGRHERVTLALGEAGPWLAFALDGDDALVLGVDDPEKTASVPGPYLELLGPGPTVAVGLRVNEETGRVIVEPGGVGQSPEPERA